jgi:MFS family permease
MRRNDRSIIAFSGISHAMVHTYELSIPILVVIWLVEFPVTTAEMGLVVGIGYGLFGAGALPGGVLADRFGSRTLITGCLVGMAGSFVLLSAAQSVWTIALALGLWGIAASVYHPAGLSLLSTGVENRGTGFAYHGMAGNVGIAFGPLATALLLLAFDWRVVALLLVVPAVGAVAYALTAEFDEMAAVGTDGGDDSGTGSGADPDQPTSLRQFLANTRSLFTVGFAVAMVIVMMNGLFYRGTLTFLPDVLGTFLPEVSEYVRLFDPDSPMAREIDLSSYLYAGLLTVGIGGQYLGGKLTDRVAPTAGLAVVFTALCLVALLFVPAAQAGVLTLLVISAALGLLLFALQPLYQATIAEYSPPGGRGLSYGYTYLASFGVGAAGAAIAGYLLSVVDVGGTFAVLAVFPALGAVLALLLFRSDWG